MKVRITFTREVLGTAPADPEIYERFIGNKLDKEKLKAELETLGVDEALERTLTVFHKRDNEPLFLDYQVKGFLKEAVGALVRFSKIEVSKKPAVNLSYYTYKSIMDNFVWVYPDEIPIILPEGGEITTCQRPLRAETMRGERIALAYSEQIPRGSYFECEILWDYPKLESVVWQALEYGKKKGLGQWRNSGKGRFEWKEI